MIRVQELVKAYRVPVREEGFSGALKSIFNRRFREVRAVDGISFSLGAGERIGFLGPNGAGKTTTLKILSGLLYPTSGTVEVAGFQPFARERAFLNAITLVAGQKERLIWDLPPLDTFEYLQAIYRIREADFRRTRDELVELLEIGNVVRTPTRRLSLGERMKCELAAALIHRPRVLFLDEPTIGLDVHMQHVIRRLIREYNERHGATVILTSHDLRDVEALCPRIVVIDGGKLLFDGAPKAFAAQFATRRRLTVSWDEGFVADLFSDADVAVVQLDDGRTAVTARPEVLRAIAARLDGDPRVREYRVEEPPLEQVFVEVYQQRARREREAGAA